MRIFRFFAVAAALAAPSGCGVIYTSPNVSEGSILGGTELDVKVVQLTPETAIAANMEEYVPPRLPLAFWQAAATRETLADGRESTDPNTQPALYLGSVPERLPPLGEPEAYLIGVGDVILLNFNVEPTLEDLPSLVALQSRRQGLIVQDDGAIAVPKAGRVQIAGLTLAEAESEVFRALVSTGLDSTFTMEIAEFNSQYISVGGAVGSPRLVPLKLKPLYLYEAIQIAGGARADPEISHIQLIRRDQIYSIRLDRFNTDPAVRRIVLRDGDDISVRSEDHNRELAALERSNFKERLEFGAVERHYAYVTGEIRGGAKRVDLPFERTATLADVLFRDNALSDIRTMDYGEIYVLRTGVNPTEIGGVTAYNLNGSNAANLSLAGQLEMRPNDVVFVAEQRITAWNRAISQVLPNLVLRTARIATNGL